MLPAILRRIMPGSARYGIPWMPMADGSVTFHERGFVAAPSPAMLLARHNFETERITDELNGKEFSRSLEIGCGYGRLGPTFARFSKEHIAIDVNEAALALARRTYPGITFAHGNANALAYPDNTFELIVAWTVLQHVRPEALPSVGHEILRVLSPAGVLLICEETRNAGTTLAAARHTWHRRTSEYEELFSPLKLRRHGPIAAIDRLPDMTSPGEVMVFA